MGQYGLNNKCYFLPLMELELHLLTSRDTQKTQHLLFPEIMSHLLKILHTQCWDQFIGGTTLICTTTQMKTLIFS